MGFEMKYRHRLNGIEITYITRHIGYILLAPDVSQLAPCSQPSALLLTRAHRVIQVSFGTQYYPPHNLIRKNKISCNGITHPAIAYDDAS